MNSTVIVTGAASGLGRELAAALINQQNPVIMVDRDSRALTEVRRELSQHASADVSTVVADLATTEGVHKAARDLASRSDLRGLVNNVGGQLPGEQYPEALTQTWLSTLTLNLIAPMLLTQLLWNRLATNEGAVVNIGSSGGLGNDAYDSPEYGAAKAGVHRFTTSLASHNDVRVTAVIPGWIGLERAHRELAALTPQQQDDIGPLIPPADIAAEVVKLMNAGQPGEVVQMLRRGTRISTTGR